MINKEIIIITGEYYPIKSSGSYMLGDLVEEFSRKNNSITVLTTCFSLFEKKYNNNKNIKILRSISYFQKSKNKYLRLISEILIPYFMYYVLFKNKLIKKDWDLIIWYSPSIFFGKVAAILNTKRNGYKYLILRDIFPDWALNLGLIKNGSFVGNYLNKIAKNQYQVADKIGVQSISDLNYLSKQLNLDHKLCLIENWTTKHSLINNEMENFLLNYKYIAIYAGNMGISQDATIFIKIAEKLKQNSDLIFIFIGRGFQRKLMENMKLNKSLSNVFFFDEIDYKQMHSIYKKCTIGLVCLDKKHKTSNIPGKFISYMSASLPVYAIVNNENDLINIIETYKVGKATTHDMSIDDLVLDFINLLSIVATDELMSISCNKIYEKRYKTQIAINKINSIFCNE